LVLFFPLIAPAQGQGESTSSYDRSFHIGLEYGQILRVHQDAVPLILLEPEFVGIDLQMRFIPTKESNSLASLGFGIHSLNFEHPSIGNPLALYGLLAVPLFGNAFRSSWQMNYFMAIGIAGNFRPYDSLHNELNLLIGSRFGCYFRTGLELGYQLRSNHTIQASYGFSHCSNGSTKLPNLGINMSSLQLGIQYRPPSRVDRDLNKTSSFTRDHSSTHYRFVLSTGVKNYEIGGASYLKFAASLGYAHHFRAKHNIGGGSELFYSSYTPYAQNGQSTWSGYISSALFGSYEWWFDGHACLFGQLGYYINRSNTIEYPLRYYERIGVRAQILDHIFLGIAIKAHGRVADFIEISVGYQF
jgi:hypothetical protein